jgi:hypothetical protein
MNKEVWNVGAPTNLHYSSMGRKKKKKVLENLI